MTTKLMCPRCSFLLMEQTVKGSAVDHCFRCGGTFLEKGIESKILGESSSSDYWRGTEISERLPLQGVYCPKDHQRFRTYSVGFEENKVEVDLCSKCEGLWLDPKEGKKLFDTVLHEGQKKEATFNEKPGFKSYIFQAFSGMPVEAWNPVHHRPIVTMCLIALLVLTFIGQLLMPFINENFILYPQKFLAGEQLWGLLSAGFLHGGLAHLLGNLYFLYIFGDNVEDYIGKRRFLIVYLSAVLFSSLAYVIARPNSEIGVVGASGAIAALMGAYIMIFPKIKLYFTVLFVPIRLGVTWYLSFWLLFNVIMMFVGGGGVAWEAHVGGFAFGLAAGYSLRFKSIVDHISAYPPNEIKE